LITYLLCLTKYQVVVIRDERKAPSCADMALVDKNNAGWRRQTRASSDFLRTA